MTENDICSLIQRRRLQLIIHSCIYYELNSNIIPDDEWSKWAVELKDLQDKYPEESEKVIYADLFRNFDPSSGYFLEPLFKNPDVLNKANRLLRYGRYKK